MSVRHLADENIFRKLIWPANDGPAHKRARIVKTLLDIGSQAVAFQIWMKVRLILAHAQRKTLYQQNLCESVAAKCLVAMKSNIIICHLSKTDFKHSSEK